jgi:hypothetical protein
MGEYMEVYKEIGDNIRIMRSPEQDSYYNLFGSPEPYLREDGTGVNADEAYTEIVNMIEDDGFWIYYAQYRCSCCGSWVIADSLGGCIGDLDSVYEEDMVYITNQAREKKGEHLPG